MVAQRQINEHLSKAKCHKCNTSLNGAKLTPISEMPIALVAHVVCPNCSSESIITITFAGGGTVPLVSDLKSTEMHRFIGARPTTYDELLDLHSMLKKKPIWKLLQKSEKRLEKKLKTLEIKESSQL